MYVDIDVKEIFTPKLTVERAIGIYRNLIGHPELTPKSRFHGKFMYEFLPTIALASKLHAQFFTITENPSIPYDAILYLNKNIENLIEWVSAIPHEEAKRKLQQIQEFGKASAHEKLDLTSKKITKPNTHALSLADMEKFSKENLTDLIISSFKKKQDKLNRGHYDLDMHLGIIYSDFGLDHAIASKAIEKAKSTIASIKSFAEIHFISLRDVYNIIEFNF